MCGRYNYLSDGPGFRDEFEAVLTFDWEPRYNIAPSQPVPIVTLEDGARVARLASWGFLPAWARDPNGRRPINARSETVATNGMFRNAFRHRRCLIPMTGWYEWMQSEGGKIPHWIRPAAGPDAFAGIWDRWGEGDDALVTCAVLTTDAAPSIAHIHDRMPVVLDRDEWDTWLAGPPEAAASLLRPYPGPLAWHAVSRFVNSPFNEGALCVEAVG
ncbi:MAG TPA: SOS response-associated peptidase [Longimicrobiales bacterium]|nr:SOS response-associated peptidase [Longimicrobiales bacterium]